MSRKPKANDAEVDATIMKFMKIMAACRLLQRSGRDCLSGLGMTVHQWQGGVQRHGCSEKATHRPMMRVMQPMDLVWSRRPVLEAFP